MKFLKTLILGSIVLAGFRAQAAPDITCSEIETENPAKIEVQITTLRDITNKVPWAKNFDNVSVVQVVVNKIENGVTTELKSFTSISRSLIICLQVRLFT